MNLFTAAETVANYANAGAAKTKLSVAKMLLLGILAGANVIMPNLSPPGVREKYLLYDNKLCTGAEAAESLDRLKAQMEKIGYRIAVSRGDSLNM